MYGISFELNLEVLKQRIYKWKEVIIDVSCI